MNSPYQIFLGSKSPRRQQLLEELGLEFSIISADVAEVYPEELAIEAIPEFLAEKKARALAHYISANTAIITSDTIVVCNDQVLGKPATQEEAVGMLQLLSGKAHRVISGVCILSDQGISSFQDTAWVHFRALTEQEIRYYVAKYAPYDKAGAYGIQEWIGMVGIEKLEGSYYTVMGLPVHKLYTALQEQQIIET